MRKNTNPRPVPGCTLESTPPAFGCILSSESWKSRVRTQSTPRMGTCPTVSTPKIQSVIDTFFWKTFLKRGFNIIDTGQCVKTPTRDPFLVVHWNRHPSFRMYPIIRKLKSWVRTQSTPRMGICPTVSTPKIQSVIDTFFWKTFLKRSFSTKHTGPCVESPTRDTIRGARRNRNPNSADRHPALGCILSSESWKFWVRFPRAPRMGMRVGVCPL